MNEEKETILTRIEGSGIYRRIRNKTNRKLVDFLKRYALGDKTSAVVLEAAGGSGYSAHLMAQDRQVSLSISLDIDLDLFRQAGIENFQADLVIADIYSMPFRNGTFDLIWNSSSVEELPDQMKNQFPVILSVLQHFPGYIPANNQSPSSRPVPGRLGMGAGGPSYSPG